jgi:CheY-like chemotaxis protein
MKSDRDRCFAAGMDGYLTKPVKLDVLLSAIDGGLATALGRGGC